VVWPLKKNGSNKDTKDIRINYGTIQNKMVYQGTGKHQEERKELKRDKKGRTAGRKNKLKTFSSSTCIK
jgi:hypothetical protein